MGSMDTLKHPVKRLYTKYTASAGVLAGAPHQSGCRKCDWMEVFDDYGEAVDAMVLHRCG